MIDELIRVFEGTVRFVEQAVEDLTDEEMVRQPPGVPNHATWTLGHVIYSCQGMATELGGAPWLPDDWEAEFGYGSTPRVEKEGYLAKARMVELLVDARARLTNTLRGVDVSVLKQSLPDGAFPTMGDLLLQVVVAHTAYHAGQLAAWRRAIGKESAGVFV